MPLIEDACQAYGTRVRGRYTGTLYRAGCFSTHDRKLLSTGEGGFVLTDDDELAERIDLYTHLGHLKGAVHEANTSGPDRSPRSACAVCAVWRPTCARGGPTPPGCVLDPRR